MSFPLFRKRVERGLMPTLRRSPSDCGPFDALALEVVNDLARSPGLDLPLATKLVQHGLDTLKAFTPDLDANPNGPAFFAVGFDDTKSNLETWGGAADLVEIMTMRPTSKFFCFLVVDVAQAARRIRWRARKHHIPLGGFAELAEQTAAATTVHVGRQCVDA
jgi:hypothetical protein